MFRYAIMFKSGARFTSREAIGDDELFVFSKCRFMSTIC